MKTITLEDKLVEGMAEITKSDMSHLMNNIEITLIGKLKHSPASLEAIDLAKRVVIAYGAIFNSMKSKLDPTRNQKSSKEDEFLRAYWSYVAAEGTLDLVSKNNESTLVQVAGYARLPDDLKINLNSTDHEALAGSLEQYVKFISNSRSAETVGRDTDNYLKFLSNYSNQTLNRPDFSILKDRYKDIVIIGENFRIDGIKDIKHQTNKKQSPQEETLRKGIKHVALEPVIEDDIVGNRKAINLMKTEVSCLMRYDPIERRNPFGRFNQYILLAGTRGTGKTMLAKYAMTYALDIAKRSGKPLSLIELEFEDRYQCGPIDNLRYQLRHVTEVNQVFIVFLDEMDTKIQSRNNGGKEGYKNEVIGEFLRFRGGGGYLNRNNYMLIATSNKPDAIDSPILNVFHYEEIEGPITTTEKTKVLYNNLLPGIKRGNVRIKDDEWASIGNLLSKYGFTGRDIKNIATDSELRYRQLASNINLDFNLSASEVERRMAAIFQNNGDLYVTRLQDIVQSIINQKECIEKENHSYI